MRFSFIDRPVEMDWNYQRWSARASSVSERKCKLHLPVLPRTAAGLEPLTAR